MKRTPLCDRLAIELPILQAGMGRTRGAPTPPALVAAVSEAGGLWCRGAVGLDPDEIRAAIRDIRGRTARQIVAELARGLL